MAVTFTVNRTITQEAISNLLCSAFEGGSNYWYTITEYHDYVESTQPSNFGRLFK